MTTCIRGLPSVVTALALGMLSGHAYSDAAAHNGTIVRAGLVVHDVSGEFNATRNARPKVQIGMDDVGLEGNDLDRFLSASFDLGRNWQVRFDHFGYSRDGDRRIQSNLNFDDLVAPIGARVNADAELWLYVANVAYRVNAGGRWQFGLGAGVHVAQLAYELDAVATIGDTEVALGEDEEKLLLPLPNLYAIASYRLTERALLYVGSGWFSMGYDEYDGELVFTRAALEYQFGPRFGLGGGYSFLEVDVERNSRNRHEKYDIEMPGYHAYLVMRF